MRMLPERLAHLRGRFMAQEPGARGIEHWARNTACLRLGALTLCGISPAMALVQVYQEPSHEGQSPFAFMVGTMFEHALFQQDAARLIALYQHAGRLFDPVRIVNLDLLVPSQTPGAMERRRSLTRAYVQRKLQGDRTVPHLILHARLQATLLGITHDIEPDLLVASDSDACYRLGEIKSFADRDGKTSPADLRSACRQSAVGLHCLRQLLSEIGVSQPEVVFPPIIDLILKRPGSSQAILHTMTLWQECESIQDLFQQANRIVDDIEQTLCDVSFRPTLDNLLALDSLPNHYIPGCKEFCALSSQCRKQAQVASSLILLGTSAREMLAPTSSLLRAIDLLNGKGLPPTTHEESLLAIRLREVDDALQKGVNFHG